MQDTSWLDVYLSEIPHVVYQVDDWEKTEGAQHRTLVNKGNEAMAYLQFLLDYWGRLPASVVFLHGHRWGLLPARRCPILPTLPKVSGRLCKRGKKATAYLQLLSWKTRAACRSPLSSCMVTGALPISSSSAMLLLKGRLHPLICFI